MLAGAISLGHLDSCPSWLGLEPGRKTEPFPQLDFLVSRNMGRSIRDSKKSKTGRGRPKTTGPGQAQVVRMHDQQIASIDAGLDQGAHPTCEHSRGKLATQGLDRTAATRP